MANVTGRKILTPAQGKTAPALGNSSEADPLLTFMFTIQGTVKGQAITGYFTEITGPTEEVAVVKLKTVFSEGNDKGKLAIFALPGRDSREPITLKRGLTNDLTFWTWWQLVKQGKMTDARADISIIMYNRQYEPLVKWDLTKAWPTKISAPGFQANQSTFGVEELTLEYKSLAFSQV